MDSDSSTQNSTPSKIDRLKEIGFKNGHPKYGGIKRGEKHLKTLIARELKHKTTITETGEVVRADSLIIKKLIELGSKGNLKAIEMILERIDGKVRNELKAEITTTPLGEILRDIRNNGDTLVQHEPNTEQPKV